MAEAHRENGFVIRIHSNEHPPPHVHVFKAEGELKFELGSKSEEVRLIKALSPMKLNDARRAHGIVEERHEKLLKKWSEIYGDKEV